jgi:V/A-type H+-transporting ATPase subunit C
MSKTPLFASGVVAVQENKLLSKEKLNAMIEATLEDGVKMLYDVGYAGGDAKDFEGILQAENSKNIEMLKDLSPDEVSSNCFIISYDYHNLKTLLKAAKQKLPLDKYGDILYAGGLYDVNNMQVELYGDGSNLSPFMTESIEKLKDPIFGNNPKNIDVTVDMAMYKEIAAMLRQSKSPAVIKYFRTLFDFINISTTVRNKLANTELSGQLIEGGYLGARLFYDNAEKSLDEFFAALVDTDYKDAVEAAKKSIEENKNLSQYERYYKNFLIEMLREKKSDIERIEPLIYYYLSKKTEIENIRLILTCKKNKVDKKMIYQRLRENYA